MAGVPLRCAALGAFILLLCVAPAHADDPDTEVAKRYFAEGSLAYERGDYADAIERFRAAKRVRPLPAFDYNLARCFDRMDQPADAMAAYRRFLDTEPNGDKAEDARARVAVLTTRLARPNVGRRFEGGFIGLGVTGALGLATIGTGAYVVAHHASLRSSCGATTAGCDDGQRASLRQPAIAGDVLIGATAVAAVVTVVLFITEARQHARDAAPVITFP